MLSAVVLLYSFRVCISFCSFIISAGFKANAASIRTRNASPSAMACFAAAPVKQVTRRIPLAIPPVSKEKYKMVVQENIIDRYKLNKQVSIHCLGLFSRYNHREDNKTEMNK